MHYWKSLTIAFICQYKEFPLQLCYTWCGGSSAFCSWLRPLWSKHSTINPSVVHAGVQTWYWPPCQDLHSPVARCHTRGGRRTTQTSLNRSSPGRQSMHSLSRCSPLCIWSTTVQTMLRKLACMQPQWHTAHIHVHVSCLKLSYYNTLCIIKISQ